MWQIREPQPALSASLSRSLRISPIVAQILINRGLSTESEVRAFLETGLESLHDPFLLADMPRAVERLVQAVRHKETIVVHGDYDVDGLTGTALLARLFTVLGLHPIPYIPHRVLDGYGVSEKSVEFAKQRGAHLIVTADCGSTAVAEAAEAADAGMDMVITDHHEIPLEEASSSPTHDRRRLPQVVAVINPRREDCPYPFKDLSGVGVAFKLGTALVRALGEKESSLQRAYLDLVALGTIADVVPLLGENRVLVRAGLEAIAETRKPGLRALIDLCGLTGKPVTTYHVGFLLGPRLNAAGRLVHAEEALQVLLTKEESEAIQLAQRLDQTNRRRQEEEETTLKQALQMIEEGFDLDREYLLVLAREGWHEGVVGIVASRIVERFHRPAMLIALKDDMGRGSARSFGNFHLLRALQQCHELLVRYGGHHHAAGVTVERRQIPQLRQRLVELAARELTIQDLQPTLEIDASVRASDLTLPLTEEIARLSPFGTGNPKPLLCMNRANVLHVNLVGNGAHLKLRVQQEGLPPLDCIAFRQSGLASRVRVGQDIDLAFVPELNEWNGQSSVQLVVRDLRPSS